MFVELQQYTVANDFNEVLDMLSKTHDMMQRLTLKKIRERGKQSRMCRRAMCVCMVCNVLAMDGVNDPDIVSINAASAALSVSDIPWDGPVGAVRVGLVDKEVIVNPTRRQMQHSTLDLIVTATRKSKVVMLEGVGEAVFLHDLERAVSAGVKEVQSIVQSIMQLQLELGREKADV
nr:hypothetical protein BaRGS_029081 [Batillaria attramentaria]